MKRIVSFSLYNDRRRDVVNAVINCVLAPSIYPGWTCRFYLDDTVPKEVVVAFESFGHVELRWMPRHTSAAARLWRFLAAGDEDVEAVIFRDADSWLSTREAVCVQAWLASGRDFHLIRDHCYHSQPMMSGMWGVRGGVLPSIGEWISEYEGPGGTYDQGFLADWIYPLTVGRAVVHRGDQHDSAGAPTDYFHDGAVPIPDCDEVDEAVAGISWLEAHRLNAFTCSHCREVHPTYIGPIFEEIPAAALEVVESLGIATGDAARLLEGSRARIVEAGRFLGGSGFDVLCLGGQEPTLQLARRLADPERRVFLLPCVSDPSPVAIELAASLYAAQLPAHDPARPGAQIAALTRLCHDAAIDDACVLFDAASTSASSALALARSFGFRLIYVGEGDGVKCDLVLSPGDEIGLPPILLDRLAAW
jgi:hypothetical protein